MFAKLNHVLKAECETVKTTALRFQNTISETPFLTGTSSQSEAWQLQLNLQTKTTQAEATQAEATQAEATQAEATQAEATQAEATQAEATQAEATQAETTQAETTQAETTQAETTQAETAQAETAKEQAKPLSFYEVYKFYAKNVQDPERKERYAQESEVLEAYLGQYHCPQLKEANDEFSRLRLEEEHRAAFEADFAQPSPKLFIEFRKKFDKYDIDRGGFPIDLTRSFYVRDHRECRYVNMRNFSSLELKTLDARLINTIELPISKAEEFYQKSRQHDRYRRLYVRVYSDLNWSEKNVRLKPYRIELYFDKQYENLAYVFSEADIKEIYQKEEERAAAEKAAELAKEKERALFEKEKQLALQRAAEEKKRRQAEERQEIERKKAEAARQQIIAKLEDAKKELEAYVISTYDTWSDNDRMLVSTRIEDILTQVHEQLNHPYRSGIRTSAIDWLGNKSSRSLWQNDRKKSINRLIAETILEGSQLDDVTVNQVIRVGESVDTGVMKTDWPQPYTIESKQLTSPLIKGQWYLLNEAGINIVLSTEKPNQPAVTLTPAKAYQCEMAFCTDLGNQQTIIEQLKQALNEKIKELSSNEE
ncbi:eL24 family ribosomal protein [Ostreibacterium oceani]|uniref:Uncharacterized protein n=1 Tax=Ostreibacterium oceani TaxID=2654998 RepID=A0A6N7EXL6_9GAMM|nr:DUF4852 domain-containing protein [Ostreibacterium oceani]MPV86129.1 hypothetical protein [Ostreibacterium oceani]